MATIKVFNDMFEDKSEDFIYDTTRPLLEQIEEHIDKDIYKTTMVECYDPQTGETFYAPMEEDTDGESVLIVVNGQSVDKDFIPEEHDIVNVIFTPLGGQNATNGAVIGTLVGATLGILSAAALVLFTPVFITAGSLIALTVVGGFIGGLAGWSIGSEKDRRASLSGKKQNKGGIDSNQLPDVRGCSNQSLVGNNFPYVIGKHLITPFIVGDPYTTYQGTKGKDAYLTVLLCAGYAPLKLTDFKLGDFMLAYNRSHLVSVKEYTTMPSSSTEGMVVKYTGTSTDSYIHDAYYKYQNSAWTRTLDYRAVDGGTEVIKDTIITGYMEGYSSGGVPDTGEIVDFWSKNDIKMEIIQQTNADDVLGYGAAEYLRQATSGNTYGYGLNYPEVVKEQKVDANIFYIADKALDENVPVSYKGVSFPNKYRTNTVIFTESCPRSFTINLDFPSGLYRTRSETTDNVTEVVYSSISLWMCVQWRIYNKANASSDALGNDYDSWNTVNFGSAYNKTFTATEQTADKNLHSGNDFGSASLAEIYQGFRGKELQNFYSESGEGGIDEMRFSATVTLTKEQCQQVIADTNPTKCIEIRVLRVSPNYINEVVEHTEGKGMWNFSDHVKVNTVVTKTFDYQKLRDDDELVPTRVVSEADLRKLCFISVRCKADASGFIQNNFDQINCIAESFSPIWDKTEKKLLPEGIEKQTKYYGYFVGDSDVRTNRTDDATEREVTKADYEQARHDGFNWYAEKCGSNFGYLMKNIVMSNQWFNHGLKCWKLPDSAKKFNDNLSSSGFLLSLFGSQNGPEGMGVEDLNVTSMADWAETIDGLEDGSTFPAAMDYNGVHYNRGDLIPVRYEANAYLYSGTKIEDVLQKLAFTGRAVWIIDESGKVKVVFDGPVPYTKGAIASENCISSSNAYTYEEPPAGLFITYNDENDGYENNSFHVWSDGNSMESHHGTVESFSADYVTNNIQMHSLGRYVLANKILNKEALTRKIGPGGVIYSLGDVVLIQGEDLLIGDVSGRIQEVIEDDNKIYGFITDAVYEYTGETSGGVSVQGVTVIQQRYMGKSNAVTIPLSAPVTKVIGGKTYTLQPGQTNLVLFAPTGNVWGKPKGDDDPSPTSDIKYNMKTGDVVLYGLIDKIAAPYRIIKTKPETNGCFTQTLMPYNEDLYNYGAELPTFQSYITPPAPLVDSAAVSDVPTTLASMNNTLQSVYNAISGGAEPSPPAAPINGTAIAEENGIQIGWSDGGTERKDTANCYYIEITKGSLGSVTYKTDDNKFTYQFNRSSGNEGYPSAAQLANWTIKVKTENIYGLQSSWTTVSLNTTNYLTWQPPSPTNVTATAYKDYIQINWDCDTSNVFGANLYTIKRNGVTVEAEIGEHNYRYYFNRNNSEYPEKSDFDTSSWSFTVTVSNQSGLSATSTAATYDKTHYKTWLFGTPVVTVTPLQDYIEIKWNVNGDYYGDVFYNVSVNNTNVVQNTRAKSYLYYFDRNTDHYPEIDDIEDDWSFSVTATSEAYTQTQTTVTVDDSLYKTWIIATPVIAPKAYEKQIVIPLTADNESYGIKKFDIYVNNTVVASDVTSENFVYSITPMLTAAVQALSIKVREKSEAGYSDSTTVHPDVTEYKGYTPTVPVVTITSSGRSINLKWNNQDIYDYGGVLIQVAKAYKIVSGEYTPIVDPSELVWYAPALGLNPYASEDNYKQGNEGEKLNVSTGTNISFSVPLYGQTNSESVNTLYAYRVKATTKNQISPQQQSNWCSIIYIEAKATSAQDVVKAWKLNGQGEKVRLDGALGVKQIFVEELAALSANLGYITDGAMQGDQYNYWAVNDTVLPDQSLIRKGSFRVGGEHQYIQVTPEVVNGVPTGEYDIDFVINDFRVSATGDVSVNGNTFTVYDSDNNIIFQTSNNGNYMLVEEGEYFSDHIQYINRYDNSSKIMYFFLEENPDDMYYCLFDQIEDPQNSNQQLNRYRVYKNDLLLDTFTEALTPFNAPIPIIQGNPEKVVLKGNGDQSNTMLILFDIESETIESQVLMNKSLYPICQKDNIIIGANYDNYSIYNLSNDSFIITDVEQFLNCTISYNIIGNYFYLVASPLADSSGFPVDWSNIVKISFNGDAWIGELRFNTTLLSSNKTDVLSLSTNTNEDIIIHGTFLLREDIQTQRFRTGCIRLVQSEINWVSYSSQTRPPFTTMHVYPTDEFDMSFWDAQLTTLDFSDLVVPPYFDIAMPSSQNPKYKTPWNIDNVAGATDNSIPTIGNYAVEKGLTEETPIPYTEYNYIINGKLNFYPRVKTSNEYTESFPMFSSVSGSVCNDSVSYIYNPRRTTDDIVFELDKYHIAPHDIITGRRTYATGIGFTQILYDQNSDCYKYVLDSGAMLEFDKNGRLIVESSQGPMGPKGDKGNKGDPGITPQITAIAGAHINETGTPTVTQGGTAEAPTFTFDYLKGQSGAGSETAERLETPRDLKVDLESSSAQSFDGSADATSIGVSGVLPIANGGTGRTTTASGAMYATSASSGLLMGTLPVAQGGTGQTTQLATNKAIIAELTEGTADVTDGTMFVSSNATDNGFAETNDSGPNRPYKRKFSAVWNYIKSKIQNVGSLVIGIASTVGAKLKLKGMTYGTNTYADNNPKVVFENTDASQNISLTFTDFDAVQSPASLTLNGNQGGEYFIAPNVKATSSVYVGSEVVNSADNNSSWWLNKNPRGKFKGTNGGSASGWSPLLAGKTVNGKYELGSLNNTIYLNYYKDSRTTNGIDKTIFDYTVDGTPNWNGNASTASTATNSDKVDGYHASTVGPSGASQLNALVPIQYQYQQSVVGEANWIVFANGFKIMWGTKERGSSLTKGSTWTVGQSLAIMPFSSANYSITFTCESSTVGGEELSVYDKTATGFTLGMYNRNSGTTIVSPKFHWVAMGW